MAEHAEIEKHRESVRIAEQIAALFEGEDPVVAVVTLRRAADIIEREARRPKRRPRGK